ncbi:hypothetical protein PLIP_a0471 [Pseudoalteromonas lipolytica LMEB 39]|nr:hypothetical protein [Pseudoalteromonas lipolytica LMEB 39]
MFTVCHFYCSDQLVLAYYACYLAIKAQGYLVNPFKLK